MEETMATTCSEAAGTCGATASAATSNWQEEWVHQWHSLVGGFVARADLWLDQAAAMDLTTTTTSTATGSWTDEWTQFTAYGSWPEWDYYQQMSQQAFEDGWQGLVSVLSWLWLSVQPFLKSFTYLLWRALQATLGAFLPTLQYASIEICRFHLHLTWRQALGELAAVAGVYYLVKLVRWLRRQEFLTRTKRYARQTWKKYITNPWNKAKKSIQRTYQEIAQVTLLGAMLFPHVVYIALVLTVKYFYPNWVTKVSTETIFPSLLKFYYPIIVTIVVLHHARAFQSATGDDDDNNNKPRKKLRAVDSKFQMEESKPTSKARKNRRRSTIGALLRGTAPGHDGDDGEQVVYTEEDLHEDVTYWLNFWILYSTLSAIYSLATKAMFVGSIITSATVHSILCQLDFLFFIWLFALPQCLLVLFPNADEKVNNRRNWSKTKQWCYECALNPVLALPALLQPITLPFFEKISHLVPKQTWKQYVVDNVQAVLNAVAFMTRFISKERVDQIVHFLENFHTHVVPAMTLFSPGFITQYGVWYVQYIVPQAYSFQALARDRRHEQRLLYLKFWVLHAMAVLLIDKLTSIFWIVPLKTHMTFFVWCGLVLERVIHAIYNEIDRELQAFHILPKVADDLSVENTHTARALNFVMNNLPKAEDVGRQAPAAADRQQQEESQQTSAPTTEETATQKGTTTTDVAAPAAAVVPAASTTATNDTPTDEDPSAIERKVSGMRVVDLKEELKAKGLNTSGLKKDLQQRLLEAYAQDNNAVEASNEEDDAAAKPAAK